MSRGTRRKKDLRVKKEEAKPIDIVLGFRGENLNKPYLVTLNRVNRPASSPRTLPPLLCARGAERSKKTTAEKRNTNLLAFSLLFTKMPPRGECQLRPQPPYANSRGASERQIMAPLFNAALITKLIQLHSSTCRAVFFFACCGGGFFYGDTPPANPTLRQPGARACSAVCIRLQFNCVPLCE